MKKFFNKFFRKDLDLNKKWRHRAIKVVRFILCIIALIVAISGFQPNFNGSIPYVGTVVDRIADNGYYRIPTLLKNNEYIYFTELKYYDGYKENKENKENLKNTNSDLNIFCSNNRDSKNFDNLCKTYNINILEDNGNERNTHLYGVQEKIIKPCVGINRESGHLLINGKDNWFDVGGYIYTINEPNRILLCITWFGKTILTMIGIIGLSLLLYYKGVIYIIYGGSNKKK